MLIWACALHCEAKPVIDFYRLKKSPEHIGFDLYQNDHMACVVSGLGDTNMAGACAWAAAHFNAQPVICWINLGTAGHKALPVGTTLLASKIDRADARATIYPVPLIKHPFQTRPVISRSTESTDYQDSALFDMEAHAFAQTSSRFSPLELCQSVKVISDNASVPPDRDKARVSRLIADNMPAIADFADALQGLAHDYANQSLDTDQLQRFTALAHFTQSQRIQLRKALLGLRANDSDLGDTYAAVRHLRGSKQILDTLQSRLQGLCESF